MSMISYYIHNSFYLAVIIVFQNVNRMKSESEQTERGPFCLKLHCSDFTRLVEVKQSTLRHDVKWLNSPMDDHVLVKVVSWPADQLHGHAAGLSSVDLSLSTESRCCSWCIDKWCQLTDTGSTESLCRSSTLISLPLLSMHVAIPCSFYSPHVPRTRTVYLYICTYTERLYR